MSPQQEQHPRQQQLQHPPLAVVMCSTISYCTRSRLQHATTRSTRILPSPCQVFAPGLLSSSTISYSTRSRLKHAVARSPHRCYCYCCCCCCNESKNRLLFTAACKLLVARLVELYWQAGSSPAVLSTRQWGQFSAATAPLLLLQAAVRLGCRSDGM